MTIHKVIWICLSLAFQAQINSAGIWSQLTERDLPEPPVSYFAKCK